MTKTTPFIKRMRVNGGTLFSFNSSIEDIGLNINEKNNVVKMSHFALLDIPEINSGSNLAVNYFNTEAIVGAWEYEGQSANIKDGRVIISESFQNYASNLETILLDQTTYNPALQDTVSERVFWKWLKETGAIRWTRDGSSNWIENTNPEYRKVVKYVGEISAGNVRRDTFGTYNETYVLVPTSHGEMDIYWKQVEDVNYKHGMAIGNLGEKIANRDGWLRPHPDGLIYDAFYDYVDSSISVAGHTIDVSSFNYSGPGSWWSAQDLTSGNPRGTTGSNYYLTDTSAYINEDPSSYEVDITYTGGSGFSFRRSNVDCMSLQLDINELKTVFGDDGLTFNKMGTTFSINDSFEFNAALLYYSVYNSTQDTVLARNLLGVMFLDAPSGNSSQIGSTGILLPSLEKIQSTATGFGTAYSLRVNIKSDNTIDDTQAVNVDYATSDVTYAEDFADTMAELKKSIQILNQNTATVAYISEKYGELLNNQNVILTRIEQMQQQIDDIIANS